MRSKSVLLPVIKIAVSVGLLLFLFQKVDAGEIERRLLAIQPLEIAISAILLLLTIPLQAERYRRVIRLQAAIPFRGALRIIWIGSFFNQVLPSSVGGDVFRVFYLRHYGVTLRFCFMATLADRALGFIATIVITALALPWLHLAVGDAKISLLYVALVALGLSAWIGASYIDKLAVWLPVRLRQVRLISVALDSAEFLRHATMQSWVALAGFGLSVLAQILQAAAMWNLAVSMELPASFWGIAFLLPLSNLAALLPVSIAGWGVRETILISVFPLIGMSAEDTLPLSILFGLLTMTTSLPGLVLWLYNRPRQGAATMPATDQ